MIFFASRQWNCYQAVMDNEPFTTNMIEDKFMLTVAHAWESLSVMNIFRSHRHQCLSMNIYLLSSYVIQ